MFNNIKRGVCRVAGYTTLKTHASMVQNTFNVFYFKLETSWFLPNF